MKLGGKRTVDICGSALGLALLTPLLPMIAIAIKLDSSGPVFFRQDRVGRDGRLFRLFKFRSMVASAPRLGAAISVHADARVTRVGAFLRRTKLDELPQLINVLRGDMSLLVRALKSPNLLSFIRLNSVRSFFQCAPG